MDRELTKSFKKEFGANLRLARLRQRLTQEQAAELIGMSSEVYGRIERGSIFPRVNRLRTICEKFEVSADQLLGLSEPLNPSPPLRVIRQADEWFLVIHRMKTLGAKLTQAQRQAARRHVTDFFRVLEACVDPEAAAKAKRKYRKRARAQDS